MKLRVVILFYLVIISIQGFSQSVTTVGTDFWVAFQPNQDAPSFIVVINSDSTCSGNISSNYNSYSQDFTVVPGTSTEITVPSSFRLTDGITDKGLHIVTDYPVTVDCFNCSWLPESSDAYLAMPTETLGRDYYVMSCHGQTSSGTGSGLSIVSVYDGTNIVIHNKSTFLTDHIVLNRGQAYLTSAVGKEITGSRIQSDHPVVVFGSTLLTAIPPNCPSDDMLTEGMMPTQTWGKEFFTVSLAGRMLDGDVFRIMARDNLTDIKINDSLVATINGSDYYETNLTGRNFIQTSRPAMVVQFAKSQSCAGSDGKGDPFMMLIPPRQQYLTRFHLGASLAFFDWVNIVASPNAVGKIYEDGNLVNPSIFSEIGSSGYYGAQLSITYGSHTFTGNAPFEVWSYGWAQANSYGFPAGGSLSPLANVANITLSPDSALGYLNITNLCFTATVKDNSDIPLKGIMVDFRIYGMGDILDNLYTDSLGHAQFCYTRTGDIPGMDSIYAEVSDLRSTTSLAYWETCAEPVNGGKIGNSQSNCSSFTPVPIINITTPPGYSGELEYKWQQSITDSSTGFTDIPASDSQAYSPGLLTQSTWFRRLSRVTCTSGWPAAGTSNVVDIIISNQFTPEVTVSPSANPYCVGSQVTITASGLYGGANPVYQWILNGSAAGSDTTVFSWIPSPGDSIRCVFTSSLTCVTVNPVSSAPVIMNPDLSHPAGITISASPNPFCSGKMVTFTTASLNGGTDPSYQWRVNGIVTGPDTSTWSYVPSGNDVVDCRLTSNLVCVSGNPVLSSTITMIETMSVAKFSVKPVDTTISYPLITFTDESTGATHCHIDWGDGTITGCDSTHHFYGTTGTFTIKEVVGNDAGCSDSAFAHVVIRPEYSLYIPNAFTPDGDGLNDVFRITSIGGVENFSLRIFNRVGEEIFSTENPVSGWDGRFKGQLCPEGAYVYKIEFIDSTTKEKKLFSSMVFLIRK
jgi:gliding motility-associated-like protein